MVTPVPEVRFTRSADGLELAFQAGTAGDRDIVFLPYVCGLDVMWDDRSFRHVLERLERIGRVICFDYRGMGASDPVPLGGVPTPETWMEDVRAVLDASGSTRASVVANGSAGFMGMVFAATYPERVSTLVLVDAFARMASGDGQSFGSSPDEIEGAIALNAELWGTDESARYFVPSKQGDPAFREWYARFHRYVMSRGVARALIGWNFRLDLRAVVPAISVPTLVISQADSLLVGHEHSRWLAASIPNAKLIELDGGSEHFMFNSETVDAVLDATEEFITGERFIAPPHRSLATLLFTDLVNSTVHASRLGDRRWRQILDSHDEILAAEIQRYQGRTVNGTGDGVLAVFDGPARGIRCAQAICDRIHSSLGIEVRAGLHAGEVEIRGQDVGGIAVHVAARIMQHARPGEVRVSSVIPLLVAGSGIEFEDLGEHELKGVPGTWRLLAVRG